MSLDDNLTKDVSWNAAGDFYTQEAHTRGHNKRRMVVFSMPDLYMAAKNGSDQLVDGLKNDIANGGLVTSTTILYKSLYSPTCDLVDVVHYYGSTVVQPAVTRCTLPFDISNLNEDTLTDQQILNFLQILFNTNDNAETILRVLDRLKENKNDVFVLQFPDKSPRFDSLGHPVKITYFKSNNPFSVDERRYLAICAAGYIFHSDGFSRTVVREYAGLMKR